MKARGKPEAQSNASPLVNNDQPFRALKWRNTYYGPSGLVSIGSLKPGATRSAALLACPWLTYCAPLALGSDPLF